jgi:hypothetical protein
MVDGNWMDGMLIGGNGGMWWCWWDGMEKMMVWIYGYNIWWMEVVARFRRFAFTSFVFKIK